MVEQNFFSLYVKRNVIISNKLNIQVASRVAERLNPYNLRKLEKSQNLIEFMPSAYFSFQNETFVSTCKSLLIFSRIVLFHIKSSVYLRYFVNNCLWKHFFASNSPQTISNLMSLSFL